MSNGPDPLRLPEILAPRAVYALLQEQTPVMVIDVRTPAEYAGGHIAGSYNVPLDQLPEHAPALRNAAGDPIVLVCRSGARARQAERTLRQQAFPRVHTLDGGMTAWEGERLPLAHTGAARWSLERQVRGVAGGLVLVGVLGGWLAWRPLAALAGAMGGGLLVSALTDSCGLAMLLSRLPYNRTASCDVSQALRELERQPDAAATAMTA